MKLQRWGVALLLGLTLLGTACAEDEYDEEADGGEVEAQEVGGGGVTEVDAALENLLAETVDANGTGAVVLVRTPDGVFSAARGLADLDSGEDLQVTDPMRIGSSSKPFLAVVMMQLVEEGIVALDDPISTYIPGAAAQIANGDQATIRHLLTMRSGIPDYINSDDFDYAIQSDPLYPWTAAEAITYAYAMPASFAPGEGYEYSNSNYLLAEMVIASATGSTLAAELDSRVFSRIGMDDSYQEDPRQIGVGIPRGYGYGDEDITEVNNGVGLGDGGIISTASDLSLFLPALLNGELLGDEALNEMIAVIEDDDGGYYGLGISYEDGDYGEMYGHSGLTAGFQSEMYYLPDEGISVVVLTNSEDVDYTTALLEGALDAALGW